MNKWRWHIGENNKHYDGPHSDRRFPADRKKNYVRYSNLHQVRRNKRVSMIHTNWWCRDQNFRKYSKRFFGPAIDWYWFKAQGVNTHISLSVRSDRSLLVLKPLLLTPHPSLSTSLADCRPDGPRS